VVNTTVTFPTPFIAAPVVWAVIQLANPNLRFVSYNNQTTTNVSINANSSTVGSFVIRWFAVGQI